MSCSYCEPTSFEEICDTRFQYFANPDLRFVPDKTTDENWPLTLCETKLTERLEYIREFEVNGVVYPTRHELVFALTNDGKHGAWRCQCVDFSKIVGEGATSADALSACQRSFARLFEETARRRYIDFSNETQVDWKTFEKIVDLRRYRKLKPARRLHTGRVVAVDSSTLEIEWEDGTLEGVALTPLVLGDVVDTVKLLKPNDWIECVVERDFFTAELRKFLSVKKIERLEMSDEETLNFLSSLL